MVVGSPLHKKRKEQMRSFSASKEQRERNKCAKQSSKASENVYKIEKFKNEIQNGPYYICTECVIVVYIEGQLKNL